MSEQKQNEESAFDKMVQHLMDTEGYSKETATKVAAKIGDDSIGKSAMAQRAAASREKNEGCSPAGKILKKAQK